MIRNASSEKAVMLIVDDQPGNIKTLARLLRNNYRIPVATNGLKALEITAGKIRIGPCST